ncbi:protein KAKU4-like isoform X2 [Phoenix dactylifera]|uniref:Protein KAKU4-like isoform X2 n=1 Tax=Phoenix dactylifera TaxID=42345 RepID=A0A8B7MWB1_PHODC|nr:protein KAKU4-like isoform X2 [Phoenix dactylifera]
MASLFRARCRGEGGAGGKILRGRRALPPASPYARPKNQLPSPAPASLASSRSPSWFQGLISGAGKLISTVFRSEDSSCSSSSGYSSDGEISLSSDDKEDVDASSKHLHELNQGENRPNSARDCMARSQAVVSRSESKLVIEQLLMQETFTRDECNRLTKIIQSRVIEAPFTGVVRDGTHKETSDRATSSATACSGAWRSLNQNLPESIQYSASKLEAFSPGSSAVQACTPDLRDTAVMEAKKWIEEKRLESSSKHNSDCGPCTLNTDMLQYGIESESSSPIDLAKSYMRSLPPWQSPSRSSIGFKTPPPSRMHLYKDENTYATLNLSLSSSKVLKRNSLSIGFWDTLEEARRVRLKSRDDILEIPKFNQIDSSASLFENETSKISLDADVRDREVLGVDHHSNSLGPTEVPGASPKPCAELNTENLCSNGALRFSDQKASEENTLTETGNVTSIDIVSEPEKALNAVQPTNKSSLPDTNSSQPVSSIIESELKSSNHNVLILENNEKDGTELLQLQDGSIDVPQESLILASKSVELGGNFLFCNLLSEAKDVTSESIKAATPSGADGATNSDNNHTCSIQTVPEVLGILEANDSSQLNLDPGLKETHSIADSRPPAENPQIQEEANGSTHKISATGSSAESNANSDLESFSKGEPSGTNSINGEPAAAGISEGIHEPQNECAIDVPSGHDTNSVAGKSRNGTRMKSIERMLTKPQPSTSHRRRKAVAKTKRGRGAK